MKWFCLINDFQKGRQHKFHIYYAKVWLVDFLLHSILSILQPSLHLNGKKHIITSVPERYYSPSVQMVQKNYQQTQFRGKSSIWRNRSGRGATHKKEDLAALSAALQDKCLRSFKESSSLLLVTCHQQMPSDLCARLQLHKFIFCLIKHFTHFKLKGSKCLCPESCKWNNNQRTAWEECLTAEIYGFKNGDGPQGVVQLLISS